MKITKEQQEQIEEFAKLQFTIKDCELITGIAGLVNEYKTHKNVYETYQKGFLTSEAEVRKVILDQAKNGSSPAQKEILELMRSCREINRRTEKNKK